MVKPWLEAGFDCVIVDIKHPAREAIKQPKRDIFVKDPHKIHYLGSRGQEERSVTPMGFARAVFEANKHLFTNA